MTTLNEILQVVLIGAGATLVMDIWLLALKRMGVQTLNFALIGRWVGHLFYGRVAHSAIGKSWPIPHEAALGWLTHYAVGIGFAALLLAASGRYAELLAAMARTRERVRIDVTDVDRRFRHHRRTRPCDPRPWPQPRRFSRCELSATAPE